MKVLNLTLFFILFASLVYAEQSLTNVPQNAQYRHLNIQKEEEVVVYPGYVGHVVCEDCPKRNRLEKVEHAQRVVAKMEDFAHKKTFKNMSSGISTVNIKKNVSLATKVETSHKWSKIATVYFKLDSSQISEKEKNKIVKIVNDNSNKTFKIIGYTCDIGSERYNDVLAKERAEKVAAEIEQITGEKPIAEGKGKCCYVSKNKRKNRRAEIYISAKNK